MVRAKSQVPQVDLKPAVVPKTGQNPDAFEFRLLEADAKARENLNREADQRFWLRWIAVFVVLSIIVMMALMLNHVAHWLPSDTKSVGVVIALHLAPITSMSALAVALLVAAFRGFKDGDEKAGASVAAETLKMTGLGPN